MTTDTSRLSSLPFSHVVLLSVSQYYTATLMIAIAPVQQQHKKYDLKFKFSVVKYAEENSGEAAASSFSVNTKRGRDW